MADHELLTTYKTHVGSSGTANDAMLNRLLPAVLGRIQRLCGGLTLLDPGADVTEVHDGDGVTGYFYTRQRPIKSITTIHENTATPRAYAAADLVDSDDYGYASRLGKVYKLSSLSSGSSWSEGYDTIQIVYRPGWAAASIPAEFLDAAFEWVLATELYLTGRRVGVQSANAQGGNVSYRLAAMPEIAKLILEPQMGLEAGGGA